jgi:hypothetical protein
MIVLLTSDHDAPLTPVLERYETAHLDSLRSFIDDDRLELVGRQYILA